MRLPLPVEQIDDGRSSFISHSSSLNADHWTDADGNSQPFGKIPFDEGEIVCGGGLHDVDPEQDYQEYTGNEGATLEQWYRHAVIALWAAKRHFGILCEAGYEHAVAMLERMAAGITGVRVKADRELRDQCVTFAQRIIATWPNAGKYGFYSHSESPVCQPFIAVLKKLKDPQLTRGLLRGVLPIDTEPVPGKDIVALCKSQWTDFHDDFVHLFSKTSNDTIERNADLLAAICTAKDKQAARRQLCLDLGGAMVEAVQRWDARRPSDWHENKVDRVALLDSLCKSLFVTDQHAELDKLLSHIQSQPKKYLCQEALDKAGDVSAAVKDRMTEDLRLRFEHPGEYVAYVDSYRTVSKLPRLHRQVISHHSELAIVQDAMRCHPDRQTGKLVLEYIQPLGDDLSEPHELPFR